MSPSLTCTHAMDSAYLWIKAFHIVFIASWFAGLFYLPRIFINLAMDPHPAVQERLILMANKLFRFMTGLAVIAVVLGLILWGGYRVGFGQGWMHAKWVVILLIIGYHHACWTILKKFRAGQNTRSHTWYRFFNEIAVLMMIAAVVLVVVKPF